MKLISRIPQNENSTDSSPKEYFARIPEITTPLTVHRSTEVYSSITVTSELNNTWLSKHTGTVRQGTSYILINQQ